MYYRLHYPAMEIHIPTHVSYAIGESFIRNMFETLSQYDDGDKLVKLMKLNTIRIPLNETTTETFGIYNIIDSIIPPEESDDDDEDDDGDTSEDDSSVHSTD